MSWDSDIDLGIWDDEVADLVAAFPALRQLGWAVSSRSYRGRLYGVTLKPKGDRTFRPVHIHVYFRDGGSAWSPQTVTYYPVKGRDDAPGFANLPKTRQFLNGLRAQARLRRDGTTLERLGRTAFAYPLWGAFVTLRNRFERQFWGSLPPFSALYAIFTWIVPAHHFETLDHIELDGVKFPIPTDVDGYLTLRYGDWREPVRNWCYWLDDGCIRPVAPEKVISGL